MTDGIRTIDQIIDETEMVKNNSNDVNRLQPWMYSVRKITSSLFGKDSEEYILIDNTLTSIPLPSSSLPSGLAEAVVETQRNFARRSAIVGVENYLKSFKNFLQTNKSSGIVEEASISTNNSNLKNEITNEIFIVHGRDNLPKVTLARWLETNKLNPIILHEQTSGGATLIEKLQNHASRAKFAIIILTPDDVGSLKGVTAEQPRARQNVILELGYFLGRLEENMFVVYIRIRWKFHPILMEYCLFHLKKMSRKLKWNWLESWRTPVTSLPSIYDINVFNSFQSNFFSIN
ncbi:hypothetical protein BH23THE1_BH23THE1_23780 [soil metagenome]